MKQNQQIAEILYNQIYKLISSNSDEWQKTFLHIYSNFFVLATNDSGLIFNSLFSRMSYLAYQHNIKGGLSYWMHGLRRSLEVQGSTSIYDSQTASAILCTLIEKTLDTPIPVHLLSVKDALPNFNVKKSDTTEKILPYIRIEIFENIKEEKKWKAIWQDEPEDLIVVNYEDKVESGIFSASINTINNELSFPLRVQLLNVKRYKSGVFYFEGIVIEPDYLVDVTTIAQSFQSDGHAYPHLQVVSKWVESTMTPALLTGNLANFTMDLLIANPKINFYEIILLYFKNFPVDFAFLNDSDLRSVLQTMKIHFSSLKHMVNQGFSQVGIDITDCYLEPSFYSAIFGLQGRLDILYKNSNATNDFSIVELKSGMPFKANKYGVGQSHYIQILMYDLLVRSTYGFNQRPASYMLYSKLTENQLKYAPAVVSLQHEALEVRNNIYAMERQLADVRSTADMEVFMQLISPENNSNVRGFTLDNIQFLKNMWLSMSALEKEYFSLFLGFTAREHMRTKSGVMNDDRSNGQSALWLESLQQKEEKFTILSFLEITTNNSNQENPTIELKKSAKTNSLANLRTGDIAILYPYDGDDRTILKSQLFKCSIISFERDTILVRLRAPVYSTKLFDGFRYWNIENDHMDSSFNSQYQSFIHLFSSPAHIRNKILGFVLPEKSEPKMITLPENLTDEQKSIISNIIQSKDYYLLWGPPGSGKTSFIIKYMIKWLLENTNERIMLMAFTNRAVDEICASLIEIGSEAENHLIRIGSSFGTSLEYQPFLLQNQIADASNRQDIQKVLTTKRLWVGTVASINGRRELLKVIPFDRVVIDEASQLLEPMIIGLLPMFKHFLMIGDHHQLPAVTIQKDTECSIEGNVLNKYGLNKLSSSLFERLLSILNKNKQTENIGQLSYQGRMIPAIMQFPSKHFYNGQLRHLAHLENINFWNELDSTNDLASTIKKEATLFIPCLNVEPGNIKINRQEASATVKLIKTLRNYYTQTGKTFTPNSIGVITPYRSQIACIKAELIKEQMDDNDYTIDTVERYQGGARDIIILSLCINNEFQLKNLTSSGLEIGVDKKLNVAITRAKRQIFILGNPRIMAKSKYYKAITEEFTEISTETLDSNH